MSESSQHRLDRSRPPRVHITYDVEVGNSIERKELPFVVGVLADLSGTSSKNISVSERKFIEIDRDNFDEVLASLRPELALSINHNFLTKAPHFLVDLSFSSLDDFAPLNIVKNIPELSKLYRVRTLLKDLLTKIESNEFLYQKIQSLFENNEERAALFQELGIAVSGNTNQGPVIEELAKQSSDTQETSS